MPCRSTNVTFHRSTIASVTLTQLDFSISRLGCVSMFNGWRVKDLLDFWPFQLINVDSLQFRQARKVQFN
jgi:hypothetical protein